MLAQYSRDCKEAWRQISCPCPSTRVRTIFRLAFFRLTFFRPQIFVPQFFVSHFFVSQFFVSRIFVWVFFRLNYFSSVHSFVRTFFRSYIFSSVHFFRFFPLSTPMGPDYMALIFASFFFFIFWSCLQCYLSYCIWSSSKLKKRSEKSKKISAV